MMKKELYTETVQMHGLLVADPTKPAMKNWVVKCEFWLKMPANDVTEAAARTADYVGHNLQKHLLLEEFGFYIGVQTFLNQELESDEEQP